MKKNRKKKGFTLIELIVVIAILGILAVIAVPKFTGTMDNAQKKSHNANVQTLESAASVYLAENGKPSEKVTWTSAETSNGYVQKWPKNEKHASSGYKVEIGTDGSIVVTPAAVN